MGYFSNGAEGDMWEANNCRYCVHDSEAGCPVLTAHMLYNYDQNGNEPLRTTLSLLIPREGAHNSRCAMLIERLPKRVDR